MSDLGFFPINFELHSDLCIKFRADSFLCSFNTEKTFWEKDGLGGERYISWLKNKISMRFSAFHIWQENNIIGQLELGQRKPADDFGYINLYYLIPSERGQGHSAHIDRFAMEYLLSLGFKIAKLAVSPTNLRAKKFYEKNGWIDLGPRVAPVGHVSANEFPVHEMEKQILPG